MALLRLCVPGTRHRRIVAGSLGALDLTTPAFGRIKHVLTGYLDRGAYEYDEIIEEVNGQRYSLSGRQALSKRYRSDSYDANKYSKLVTARMDACT